VKYATFKSKLRIEDSICKCRLCWNQILLSYSSHSEFFDSWDKIYSVCCSRQLLENFVCQKGADLSPDEVLYFCLLNGFDRK